MNDHDAPTRELFAKLPLSRSTAPWCYLRWPELGRYPESVYSGTAITLDTVEKLRAACLLLGIPWPSANEKGEPCRG